jgi:hypothetical protein
MSVCEIQTLAQRFADAFDKRDMKAVLEMLSDDVEVLTTSPIVSTASSFSQNTSTKRSRGSLDELWLPAALVPRVQR